MVLLHFDAPIGMAHVSGWIVLDPLAILIGRRAIDGTKTPKRTVAEKIKKLDTQQSNKFITELAKVRDSVDNKFSNDNDKIGKAQFFEILDNILAVNGALYNEYDTEVKKLTGAV